MIIQREVLKTEEEWLAADCPGRLLDYLWQRGGPARSRVGRRKLRLFACACCRRTWHLLGEDGVRQALETCERYADGRASNGQRRQVRSLVRAAANREEPLAVSFALWGVWYAAQATAIQAAGGAHSFASNALLQEVMEGEGRSLTVHESRRLCGAFIRAEWCLQTRLLREIFGNPFRPVPLDPHWLTWGGGTIPKLARDVYEDRRLPEGTLDRDRLAVLADALEEAGCTEADLLGHLRGPDPHVRGCWAVDLFLGGAAPPSGLEREKGIHE
jgi:hypothetical protein